MVHRSIRVKKLVRGEDRLQILRPAFSSCQIFAPPLNLFGAWSAAECQAISPQSRAVESSPASVATLSANFCACCVMKVLFSRKSRCNGVFVAMRFSAVSLALGKSKIASVLSSLRLLTKL